MTPASRTVYRMNRRWEVPGGMSIMGSGGIWGRARRVQRRERQMFW